MALTRSRPTSTMVAKSKHETVRRQFQTTVIVLSCYYILFQSPSLITNLYYSAKPASDDTQPLLSPLSVPSFISTHRQLVVFFCRFLFHVQVAGKLLLFSAFCPAFRRSLLLLVTCSCCGTRHHDLIVWVTSSSGADSRQKQLVASRHPFPTT